MSFTVADLPDFLELLRQHPEWRDSVRYELAGDWLRRAESVERRASQWEIEMHARFDRREEALDTAIAEMRAANARDDERFAAVDLRFDAVDERFDAVDTRFDKMDERFDKMDQRLDGVDASLGDLKSRMGNVETTLTNHTGRFGNLEGAQYEDRYHAVAQLADRFRRLAVISIGDVEELLDSRDAGVVTAKSSTNSKPSTSSSSGRAGKGADAPVVYVALEVSLTLASSDIRRAAERAAILRKAGLDARAFAGGRNMPAQLRQLADELAVTILIDQDEAAA